MLKELLELRPRQYLCPLCGTWHQWNERDTLQSRSNSDRWTQTIFENESKYPKECAYGGYAVAVRPHVDEKGSEICGEYDLYYSCQRNFCNYFELRGKVTISTFKEQSDKPIVTVDVPLVLKSEWGNIKTTCKQCRSFKNCNFYKQYIAVCIAGDFAHPKVQLGFEFDPGEYEKFSEAGQKRRAEALKKREYDLNHLEERERTLNGKEQALEERERTLKKREQALEEREQALQKQKMNSKTTNNQDEYMMSSENTE